MLVAFFLAVCFLLAALASILVYRGIIHTQWARLFAGLCLAGFTYLYAPWIFLSAYARTGFALAILLLAALAWANRSRKPGGRTKHKPFYLLLSAFLLLLIILFYTGTASNIRYADIAFPLRNGSYYVFQGGKGLPANIFHFNARRAVYAMDLVKLDRWGRRCSKVYSRDLKDYYIFGDTIYSPCNGVVQRAVDANPDNIPPAMERGPRNLNGVLIEGDSFYVYLGHLQQGKVFVKPGELVAVGEPIGLVGNSGKSLEPHLHMQVHKKLSAALRWYESPQLFMRFAGKENLLFEEID